MRKLSAIVLFAGMLAMNTGTFCQSLCRGSHHLEGPTYNDTGHGHAVHMTAKHEMPKGDICPITNSTNHDTHHSTPQTYIECDCSQDLDTSTGYAVTLTEPSAELKPHLYIISKLQSSEIVFLSNESIPLEGPPKILA